MGAMAATVTAGIVVAFAWLVMRQRRDPHACARAGRVRALAELIDADRAVVSARDRAGETPLHHAARQGARDALALLIERGADVDAATDEGTTALHMAAWWRKTEIARTLIARGAQLDVEDCRGVTPAMAARVSGARQVWDLLRQAGADVSPWIPPLPVPDDDPCFAAARADAAASAEDLAVLTIAHPGAAMVKLSVTSDTGVVEKVWASVMSSSGDNLIVTIQTPPSTQKGPFDRLRAIELADVEDWLVELPSGALHGAFGLRRVIAALRERGNEPPPELTALDLRAGIATWPRA